VEGKLTLLIFEDLSLSSDQFFFYDTAIFNRIFSGGATGTRLSAMSASVEQCFLAAADICGQDQGNLAAKTIERCVSSHQWIIQGIKPDGPGHNLGYSSGIASSQGQKNPCGFDLKRQSLISYLLYHLFSPLLYNFFFFSYQWWAAMLLGQKV
jgi:hypothetical protein